MHGKKHGVSVRRNDTASLGKKESSDYGKGLTGKCQRPTDHQGHQAPQQQEEYAVPEKLFGNDLVVEGKEVFL